MKRSALSIFTNAFTVVIAVVSLAALPAMADVKLPHVIGSHMVLQRDMPLTFWGWADLGEEVTIKLGTSEAKITAKAEDGAAKAGDGSIKWMVKLPAMPAGGPHTMTISGKNKIELTDILIGEVWVCSGQSNMEMGITQIANAEKEVTDANYPKIRLFKIPKRPAGDPEGDVDGAWNVCTPQTIVAGGWGGFTAAGYFFGREVHKTLDVPVGLIDTTWGGTRIEPWTPPAGFAGVPALADILKAVQAATPEYKKALAAALPQYESWLPNAKQALDAGKPVPPPPAWPHHALAHEGQPTGLYNGMVYGIVPFPIRGALWYQGESNCGEGMLYFEKMKALIEGWRKVWNQGEFPFYFVQIAPWSGYGGNPLPYLWEAQSASLSIPNTGMAATTDISDLKDIHPKNKQDVGKRLALWAMAKVYGKNDLIYRGPAFKSMAVEGGKAKITFDFVGGGLVARDGKDLNWFEIAGADKKFVPARATVEGDSVVVSAEGVTEPVAVRFGWSKEAEPNLSNKEGLPAEPFRTDKW